VALKVYKTKSELKKNNTPLLIGTFHRSPISPLNTFDLIKLSIHLAVDTGVDTILILGDFNKDQRNRKKIENC